MPPQGASSGKINRRLGYCIALVSIGANLVLFGLKLWAGLSTGSVAAIADAWHTLSDSFTSAVVIMGFIVSSKSDCFKAPQAPRIFFGGYHQ